MSTARNVYCSPLQAASICYVGYALAADTYNAVSSDASDLKQYLACKTYLLTKYASTRVARRASGSTRSARSTPTGSPDSRGQHLTAG